MKRFYKTVTISTSGDGFEILLDGRCVRTPARASLLLLTQPLAYAVAGEWEAQGDKVEPRSMPLTGLANAAIDRVAPNRQGFAADLARYGESDVTYYRAEEPAELVARQAAAWDPLLDWARARYDVAFEPVAGIMHRAQPAATVARLAEAVSARDAFALAALSPLVTISGSLLIALALAEGEIGAETAFDAAHLDELWQAERWGEDALATQSREARRRDFNAASRFLSLL